MWLFFVGSKAGKRNRTCGFDYKRERDESIAVGIADERSE